MTLDELLILMQRDITQLKGVLETHNLVTNITDAIKQYDPLQHDIKDVTKRKDKEIKDGDNHITGYIPISRLPLSLQKKIVLTAAAFLGTPEIEATPNNSVEENMMEAVLKTWDDNKLDYKFKNIAKKTMSQRQAAELWYLMPVDADYWADTNITGKAKLSMRILSYDSGDSLYPVFDEFGDMIAFGRGYEIKTVNDTVQYFDIYTADFFYYTKSVNGVWWYGVVNPENTKEIIYSEGFKGTPNPIGKIPVIYYFQPFVEWEDVQPLIDRLEVITSNHADTNDYSGSPIVVASGIVTGFSEKGEQGKVLQAENGAKVEYLTFDGAPESIKMEIENLLKYIYNLTHTPDISFEQMKGLGVFSGVALRMLFLDAHLKASDKEEIFGEALQRRINYLKAALVAIDGRLKPALNMKIKPKFSYFLPANFVEELSNIKTSLDAGIISKETAIKLNPLVSNAEDELEAIKKEKEANTQPELVPPIPQKTNINIPVKAFGANGN